jgi:hypothetical protein
MSTEIDSDALICSEGIIIDQQSVYKSLSIIIAVSLLLVSVTVKGIEKNENSQNAAECSH